MAFPTPPAGAAPNAAMLSAVSDGVEHANNVEAEQVDEEARQREENEVKALWEEYDDARKFDKHARAQFALDRRYAAGTAHIDYPVDANLIGAFIDILVSFLYARNPDVSVKKAPRVDNRGTKNEDDFAKTMQIIVSKLWRAPTARLKVQGRKQVRSALAIGEGWLKVILQCKGTNIPQMQNELNDSRTNMAMLEELKSRYAPQPQLDEAGVPMMNPDGTAMMAPSTYVPTDEDKCKSEEEVDAELLKLRELEASLTTRLEVAVRKALVVDFVPAETMQVSLDVADLNDYLSASWNANFVYKPVSKLAAMFPRLSKKDLEGAKHYFHKRTRDLTPLSDTQRLTGLAGAEYNADEADQFTSNDGKTSREGAEDIPFAKIVELWNRDTGHVHTMIEGVKRWAKEPYQPDYPTSRFFPYFRLAFYEVDGARHSQSLSWRLMKLQDEYASVRSSQRQVRKRAVPGVIFNAAGVSSDEAKKVSDSTYGEYVPINPTDKDKPLRDLFAPKPVEVGDMRLYDVEPILRDMERLSGVQEALAQTSQAEKTATQAEIEQTGFASRTTSDRDTLETMLSELANYTAELAIGALDMDDATRMAGSHAFWPAGMSVDDMLTMLELEIEAGTTGKPKNGSDKEAWAVVLPQLKEMLLQIVQAKAAGQTAIADSLTALVQETMIRMGDETDITKFIPDIQPAVAPTVPGAAPGAAAPGGAPPPGGGTPPPDGAVPPPVSDELVPPDIVAPELATPELQPPVQ